MNLNEPQIMILMHLKRHFNDLRSNLFRKETNEIRNKLH